MNAQTDIISRQLSLAAARIKSSGIHANTGINNTTTSIEDLYEDQVSRKPESIKASPGIEDLYEDSPQPSANNDVKPSSVEDLYEDSALPSKNTSDSYLSVEELFENSVVEKKENSNNHTLVDTGKTSNEKVSVPGGTKIHAISSFAGEIKTRANNETSDIKNDSQQAKKSRLVNAAVLASAAASMSTGLFLANQTSGANVMLHEYGHYSADKMINNNCVGFIQADGVENLNEFLKKPSMESFRDLIMEYDLNHNQSRGYYLNLSKGDLTEFGKNLSENQREVMISAAGSIAESIPTFAAFGAGFMLRKKHPLLGYTLMTYSALSHFRSSLYPLTAVFSEIQAIGNDWTNVSKFSGLNPALVTGLFASTLPVLALGLYSIEKLAEKKSKERMAIVNLIGEQKISMEELNKAFSEYEGKDKFSRAEEKAAAVFSSPISDIDDDILKKSKKVRKALDEEYSRFSDYLIEKFESRVKNELPNVEKQIAKTSFATVIQDAGESFRESWKNDKPGTILKTASTAASGAVLGAVSLEAAGDILCATKNISISTLPEIFSTISKIMGTLGKVLVIAVPAAGIIGLASSCYNTGKILCDKKAEDSEKIAAVSNAIFAGIGTAGLVIPGLGLPLIIIGITGQVGTWANKTIYDSIDTDEEIKAPGKK